MRPSDEVIKMILEDSPDLINYMPRLLHVFEVNELTSWYI